MATISYSIPTSGQPNSTEDPKVATALQTLLTWANGNIDAVNLSAVLAQAAGVNQSGQTVSGSSIIATSESRTNVAYGTLTTPDQVAGVVLPSSGLIQVLYQATWQESVQGAANAAIFVGANQVQRASALVTAPAAQAALIGSPQTAANATPLATYGGGLASLQVGSGLGPGAYTGDVTTGQIVGGGLYQSSSSASPLLALAGPCFIFAAAGTYTVSVQFKSSSGSVTASNRRLYVRAISF